MPTYKEQGRFYDDVTLAQRVHLASGNEFVDVVRAVGVVEQGRFRYEDVGASATDQILGPTGAVGDFLHKLIITVNVALTAAVILRDGNGASIALMPNSPGGGLGVYVVEFNLQCVNAVTPGWKVTTGVGSTVLGIGRFT